MRAVYEGPSTRRTLHHAGPADGGRLGPIAGRVGSNRWITVGKGVEVARVVAHVPGSKSATARALFLAAAAGGISRLRAPLVSDDTRAFFAALAALGFETASIETGSIETGRDEVESSSLTWAIGGNAGGPTATAATAWCHDSGTTARFLPALAALGHGEYVIDASEQMRARPMETLVSALRQLDVEIEAAPGDRLPLTIHAHGVAGGSLSIDGSVSSQYLSALCMMAPATAKGLEIEVHNLVSVPYVELTLAMMRDFGADATMSTAEAGTTAESGTSAETGTTAETGISAGRTTTIVIEPTGYQARDYMIEPDASTASYFFAAAAVTGNTVTVPGLGSRSLQGDLRFATEVLASMGCTVEITEDSTTVTGPAQLRSPGEVNMRDISDTMMTLAAIAPFADAPIRIVDVANTRVKESDRIDAITEALNACGITTRTGPDWLEIDPGTPTAGLVKTRSDHRIAMSMSVLGLLTPGVEFDNPGCVAKTYPDFHEDFAALDRAWKNES
jgi:3-phosphoshikimate 1-carboxyvinyltransferase